MKIYHVKLSYANGLFTVSDYNSVLSMSGLSPQDAIRNMGTVFRMQEIMLEQVKKYFDDLLRPIFNGDVTKLADLIKTDA